MHNLSFSYKKATQSLNYFASKLGGELTKLHALKLVFFVDRYHLRKYGRPVTNDQYWAMQFGPVASSVKEMAELDSLCGTERHYAEKYLAKVENKPDFWVKSLAPVDEDVFSDSELESLAFVYSTFGSTHSRTLVEVTHKYPEWRRHELALHSGKSRVPMDYADFFDDPESGVNPCWALSAEEKKMRREQFRELDALESAWR